MMTEAEYHSPSKAMTLLVVLFAGVLALFAVSLIMTDFYKLKTVIYTPNPYMTEEILLEQMGIRKENNIVFLMSEHILEQQLLTHPFIEQAEVTKILPGGLDVKLIYRTPFFSIYNSGFYILLDESLRVLGVDPSEPEAVGVSGFRFREFKIGQKIKVENQQILERTVDLVILMKKSHLAFSNVIEYKDDSVFVQTQDGIRGSFGEVENVERRFNDFVVIYESLKEKGTTTGLIDVSTEGLPTFKPFDQ
ncbi:cell division protein FtsQ/DivIB [Acidaminobacter hydrogenoformans]|uniref:Cell division septal protein FtsQ n=1 Tax=Acidaminobacter hydrogenoformans DSM 2784 TaxID=1120920 RepID=A0A1G5RTI2_9FIRM|nr:FtsQ-type POTRA domain-containing protein [Acidaminobacter hydrogenoformans]SCZ77020.1 Cell division septal protein FtsQ [Acidaminobacter hydrogenoformans DSM 2784]